MIAVVKTERYLISCGVCKHTVRSMDSVVLGGACESGGLQVTSMKDDNDRNLVTTCGQAYP